MAKKRRSKSLFKIKRFIRGVSQRSYYEDSLKTAINVATQLFDRQTNILYKNVGGVWKKLKTYSWKDREVRFRHDNNAGGIVLSRSRKKKRKIKNGKTIKFNAVVWRDVRIYNPMTGKYSDGFSRQDVIDFVRKNGNDDVFYRGKNLSV